MDTMLERIREEGIQEGRQEAKKEIYENLLKKSQKPPMVYPKIGRIYSSLRPKNFRDGKI